MESKSEIVLIKNGDKEIYKIMKKINDRIIIKITKRINKVKIDCISDFSKSTNFNNNKKTENYYFSCWFTSTMPSLSFNSNQEWLFLLIIIN